MFIQYQLQWPMGKGQWAKANGQWPMGNGQWPMANGQCTGYRVTLSVGKYGLRMAYYYDSLLL